MEVAFGLLGVSIGRESFLVISQIPDWNFEGSLKEYRRRYHSWFDDTRDVGGGPSGRSRESSSRQANTFTVLPPFSIGCSVISCAVTSVPTLWCSCCGSSNSSGAVASNTSQVSVSPLDSSGGVDELAVVAMGSTLGQGWEARYGFQFK